MFFTMHNLFISCSILLFVSDQAFGQSRKSDLFLLTPFIRGDPPGLGESYTDDLSSRSVAAHKILYGHYSAVLEKRQSTSNTASVNSLAGRSLMGLTKSPTVPPTKPTRITKILDVFRENLYTVIDNAVNITLGDSTPEFSQQVESCKDEFKTCSVLPELMDKCGAHCLLKGHNILSELTDLVASLLEEFCQPMNTLFHKMFTIRKGNYQHFRSFRLFLKAFKSANKPLSEIAKYAVEALVPVIIDMVRTDMMPFRLVSLELDIALDQAERVQPMTDAIILNRYCTTIDDQAALINLVDILAKEPSFMDVMIEGFASMSLVTKYIPGPFQMPFASSLEAIKMLTGTNCGLVHYGSGGSAACDKLGGYPVVGLPLPEHPDLPEDCVENKAASNKHVDVAEDFPEKGIDETGTIPTPDTAPPPAAERRKRQNEKNVFGNLEKDGVQGAAAEIKALHVASAQGSSGSRKKRHTLLVGRTTKM